MIERFFSAVLTFAVLAGGTYAVGSELFAGTRQTGAMQHAGALPHTGAVQQAGAIELPRVQVTGRRHAALIALAHGDSAPLLCLQ